MSNSRIDKEICRQIDYLIKSSLAYSWKHYPELSPFITKNAQEMEEDVMRKHIQLYVNEYSADLGEKGRNAINTLFSRATTAGIISGNLPESIFY